MPSVLTVRSFCKLEVPDYYTHSKEKSFEQAPPGPRCSRISTRSEVEFVTWASRVESDPPQTSKRVRAALMRSGSVQGMGAVRKQLADLLADAPDVIIRSANTGNVVTPDLVSRTADEMRRSRFCLVRVRTRRMRMVQLRTLKLRTLWTTQQCWKRVRCKPRERREPTRNVADPFGCEISDAEVCVTDGCGRLFRDAFDGVAASGRKPQLRAVNQTQMVERGRRVAKALYDLRRSNF